MPNDTQTNRSNMTRRSFLRTSGAAATVAMMTARSRANTAGANDRLRMGFIGCGGMAGAHLNSLLAIREEENMDIVAVCDVWQKRARAFQDKIKANGGDAKQFVDYHDVLAMKDLDYVLIATPEHSHAYLTLAALDANKHVYCEKPLTHTIPEALEVVAKAKEKSHLKLQVGIQGTSDDSYITAYDAIRAGKIGPVVEAQIDYVRRYPTEYGPWRSKDTDPAMDLPADLNWNAWLEPAPERSWSPPRYLEWRNYRDYSGGIGTDLFVHRITRLIVALGLKFPEYVAGLGGIFLWPDGRDLPDNIEMLAQYGESEGVSPAGLTVHVLGTMANNTGNAHMIRGHEGRLVFEDPGWKIYKPGKDEPVEVHKRNGAEDITLHHKNHHAAIRGNAELKCPAELGLYSIAPVVMCNESWFTKKLIAWDDVNKCMKPA